MNGRVASGKRARSPKRRRASAAVELALMLPVLSYITVVTVDYSRLFFMWSTITASAFDGAMYLSSASVKAASPYSTVSQAALADATNLTASATNVTSTTGTNGNGYAYVQVTVTYNFTTLFNYPGIPNAVTLTRTLQMLTSPF